MGVMEGMVQLVLLCKPPPILWGHQGEWTTHSSIHVSLLLVTAQNENVVGEIAVGLSRGMIGSIREWEATAPVGRRRLIQTPEIKGPPERPL